LETPNLHEVHLDSILCSCGSIQVLEDLVDTVITIIIRVVIILDKSVIFKELSCSIPIILVHNENQDCIIEEEVLCSREEVNDHVANQDTIDLGLGRAECFDVREEPLEDAVPVSKCHDSLTKVFGHTFEACFIASIEHLEKTLLHWCVTATQEIGQSGRASLP
jgi:hypothetical protein